MLFYKPTGPLSGVTTSAILVWLVAWTILNARWRGRNVAVARVHAVAFLPLGLSLLLTFPPVADFFERRRRYPALTSSQALWMHYNRGLSCNLNDAETARR